ncbi:hypothetical protein K438DRAFT_1854626 [Mycena galopus ATCC 62051]|nr:hypothetical protein K438DRAFT_1854626 [Mycena galopus ATCC 62051]
MLARLRPRLPRHPTRALHASASARLASYTPYDPTSEPREEETVDACIVGGGPAGLSAAVRLEQLELEPRNEVHIVVFGRGHQALCPGRAPPRLAYDVSRPPTILAGDELRNALAEIRHHDPTPTAHEQQQNHIASLSWGHRKKWKLYSGLRRCPPSPLPRRERARRAREQGA